jgi:2-polyprenyl-3-methyl-5-hydroxy-6-metoxy-1,4-benzoquinol methylase
MPSCPICNSANTIELFVKDNIIYLKCKSCFFVFSKPSVNVNFQENIEDFEDVYLQYFDANATDQKNFNLLLSRLEKTLDLFKSKILDIGCGSGKFVNYLSERKIDCYGVEPSQPLYNKYLKGDNKFYNSTIDDFSKSSNIKFDVITLLDVLEHIEYPSAFIDHIIQLQAPNGYLIIEIPLYGSWLSKISGKNWHFFNKYHLSYFTKSRLISLMNEKGYELVLSSYRGKYFNIAYFINYIYYFIFRKQNLNIATIFRNRSIYLNTYDILLTCFKKKS